MQSGLRMKEELWRLLSSSNCYWLLAKHLVPVSPTSITSELLSEAWKICLHMFSLSSRPPNSVFQAWGEATKSMKLSVTFSIDWFWVWKLDNVLLLQVLFLEFFNIIARCFKIEAKVSLDIVSKANYVYLLGWQKFIKIVNFDKLYFAGIKPRFKKVELYWDRT